jgi:hypothetical protein
MITATLSRTSNELEKGFVAELNGASRFDMDWWVSSVECHQYADMQKTTMQERIITSESDRPFMMAMSACWV